MAEPADTEVVEDGRAESDRRLPQGHVVTFPNWCKGCDLCVEFCPAGVLELGPDGHAVVAHPEKCSACRWCELHCPDFAIFVTGIEREEGDTRQTDAG